MRLVKDRESYEGANKGRKKISEKIAYESFHFEPLDEPKQSLTPHMSLRGHEVAVAVSFCHCEGVDVPKGSLCKAYKEATKRSPRFARNDSSSTVIPNEVRNLISSK